MVGDEWRREERLRRVQDPAPLPVRWTAADPLLSDHVANIRRSPDGTGGKLGLDGVLPGAVEAFMAVPSHRLVVVGPPGAGKTVFAIRFTLDLLTRRKPGEPVPVIFGLHTWDPHEQSLQDWMAKRLTADYPALRNAVRSGRTIAAELVRRRLILPVLDGLDEIGEPLRGAALRALNMSLDYDAPVIVTCREADYRQIVATADVLTSAAVVQLLPLELTDLASYLPRTARKVPSGTGSSVTTKWDSVLERIRVDPAAPGVRTLMEVLRTPLMTSLARTVYSDTVADPAVLLDGGFPGRQEIEDHLLDAFIPAAFASPGTPGTRRRRALRPADAERWLRFLARHLDRLGTRDLEWWRLLSAVPPPVRWLLPGFIVWVIVGAIYASVQGPAPAWSLGACAAIGLVIGLAAATARPRSSALGAPDRTPGHLRVMLRRLCYVAAAAAPVGIITGSAVGLDAYASRSSGNPVSAMSWLGTALFAGLALGVVLGATGVDAQQAPMVTPLRLRRKSRVESRRLASGLGYRLLNGILAGIALWTAWGLGYGAAAALGLQAAPAFPSGGVVHHMPDDSDYADYPGGLRYVITGKGQKYVMTIKRTYIYQNSSTRWYFEKKADCLVGGGQCSLSAVYIFRNNRYGGALRVTGAAGTDDLLDDDGIIAGWLKSPQLPDIGRSIGHNG